MTAAFKLPQNLKLYHKSFLWVFAAKSLRHLQSIQKPNPESSQLDLPGQPHAQLLYSQKNVPEHRRWERAMRNQFLPHDEGEASWLFFKHWTVRSLKPLDKLSEVSAKALWGGPHDGGDFFWRLHWDIHHIREDFKGWSWRNVCSFF